MFMVLFCFVVQLSFFGGFISFIYPYSSGLVYWHKDGHFNCPSASGVSLKDMGKMCLGSNTEMQVPGMPPWWIWVKSTSTYCRYHNHALSHLRYHILQVTLWRYCSWIYRCVFPVHTTRVTGIIDWPHYSWTCRCRCRKTSAAQRFSTRRRSCGVTPRGWWCPTSPCTPASCPTWHIWSPRPTCRPSSCPRRSKW